MYFSALISARRRLSAVNDFLLVGSLAFLTLVVGCGRSSELPMTEAQRLFHQGDFESAVGVLDKAIAESTEAAGKADLLALKGRCYWELAHRTDEPPAREAHLQKAISILTQSIEAKDNAESRHIRSLIYETLGDEELAMADKVKARELDETLRRAYLNERPERILVETVDLDESLAEADEPEGQTKSRDLVPSTEEDQGMRTGVPEWSAPDVPGASATQAASEPTRPAARNPLSRASDVPWTSSGAAAAAVPGHPTDPLANRLGQAGPLAPLPGDAGPRTATGDREESDERRLRPGDPATGEPASEGEPSTDEEPETSDERSGDEPESSTPWMRPRSTWPAIPPSQLGAPPGWNSAPTTGLVGPMFRGRGMDTGPATSLPSAPTTGITGPPGFAAGQASPLATPGMAGSILPPTATTGVGTAPRRTAPGAGLAPQSPGATASLPHLQPQAGPAVAPQTRAGGGLPSTATTRGFMPGFGGGGIGPDHLQFGPHYNPLRPSPLTTPQLLPQLPQMPLRPPMTR